MSETLTDPQTGFGCRSDRDSPAWAAGLRPQDTIVSVNQQPVKSVQDLAAALRRDTDRLLINIRRGRGALFIVIQ